MLVLGTCFWNVVDYPFPFCSMLVRVWEREKVRFHVSCPFPLFIRHQSMPSAKAIQPNLFIFLFLFPLLSPLIFNIIWKLVKPRLIITIEIRYYLNYNILISPFLYFYCLCLFMLYICLWLMHACWLSCANFMIHGKIIFFLKNVQFSLATKVINNTEIW